ncbi:MAG: CDP-alcohol phosphatidyltransferase family protein [Pseudomonadota bacterium]
MLQYLPNFLTMSRLLLAAPLGYLVWQHEYEWALAIGLLAGATDAMDGFFARRLHAFSRLGAVLDPIADKTLITVTFVSCASTGLIPWYLAIVVMLRDAIIVAGAAAYHRFIGEIEFSATPLSKVNMVVQIVFCVMVIAAQVWVWIPETAIMAGSAAVLFFAGASGFDYVMQWSIRAFTQHRLTDKQAPKGTRAGEEGER